VDMRLFDDLDRLDDVLLMVHFHRNVYWHMYGTGNDSRDNALNRVRAGHLYDFLNNFLLVLRLFNEDLSGNWYLDDLLHDALHRVWHVTGNNLFHRYRHAYFLGNSYFVGLREGSVDCSNDFAGNLVGNWAINNSFHRVWDANFLGNSNFNRHIDLLVDNFSHWIRDRYINNPLDGIRDPAFDDLHHGVRNLDGDLVRYLVRSVHPALNNFLHGVRHWSVDNALDFNGNALFNHALVGLRNRTVHNLLNSVRYADFLTNAAFHRGRDWNWTVNRDVHMIGHVDVAHMSYGVGAIHVLHDVNGNGNLHWHRHVNCTGNFHNLLDDPLNWNRDTLLNELFNWVRDPLFHNLFNWDWNFDADILGDIHVVRLGSVDDSLHWVRNSCLNNSLLHLLNGHIDHFVNNAGRGIHILSVSNSWLNLHHSLVYNGCPRVITCDNWTSCHNCWSAGIDRAASNNWTSNMSVSDGLSHMLIATENHD
jgi:hypothetical protein